MKHILVIISISFFSMQSYGMYFFCGKKKQAPTQQLQSDQRKLPPKNDEFFVPDNQKSIKDFSQKK